MGLEQGEGLMPPVTGNEVLARAELPNPMPVPVAMGNKEEWLRKREEGKPAPWPPELPINTLLLPSRLEMGSWPPLATRAVKETVLLTNINKTDMLRIKKDALVPCEWMSRCEKRRKGVKRHKQTERTQ